jgi:eukaryotic-like serine/threonine-protein kinase
MSASKIGRFEILSEVAHSEQSSVYRATDTATNRPVALKAFNLDLAGDDRPNLVKRLIQEAESTRNLSHQNIVLLYGAGEIDGRFCVATEYVEGFSIAANLAKGERYTVWDMLDISRQVCNGLDHAHNHGVVHRRLQPANVLIQWDGTVKILGFGIAGMWSEEDSPGVLSSASYYASPEQVRGQSLHTRSNLFSWGAILYEMATGTKAFQGENVDEVRKQILEGQPVPPIELNPKVTPNLSALILKAISKVPAERFATGRELLVELESCKEAPKQAAVLQARKAAATAKPAPVAPPPSAGPKSSVFAAKLERTSNGEQSDDDSFDDDMLLDAAGNTPASAAKPLPRKAAPVAHSSGSAAAAAPALAPKFNVDPMMSGEGMAAAPSRSFADSELPPLAAPAPDQFAAPIPTHAASAPVANQAPAQPGSTLFTAAPEVPEKKKFALPQIESKLLIHGLIGGLAIILLVVGIIALYVHFHTSDDEGAPLPAAAAKPSETPAEVPANTPASATSEPAPAAEPEPAPDTVAAAPATEPASRAKAEPRVSKRGREAVPHAPLAVAPGVIAVDSSPQGAQIQVDGRVDSNWVTPFTLSQLAPGTHTLVVSKAGYSSETKSLTIASGSKNALSVHLNILAATISVTSDPSGGSIFIDGRDSNKVTPSLVTLDKGSHSVQVRKPGYLDETMTAEVQPGQNIGFSPHLRQLGSTDEIRSVNKMKKLFGGKEGVSGMGSVAIRTTPKGAQIAINQRVLDHLSPAEFLLNPGNYVVDITASGYKPLHRVITVEKNGKLAIDETLERE